MSLVTINGFYAGDSMIVMMYLRNACAGQNRIVPGDFSNMIAPFDVIASPSAIAYSRFYAGSL